MKQARGPKSGKGGTSFGRAKPRREGERRDFNNRGFDKPTMHRATCAKCNAFCEVPFRPNGSKPVYCSNCFSRDDDRQSYARPNRSSGASAPRSDRGMKDVLDKLDYIERKLDRLIESIGE